MVNSQKPAERSAKLRWYSFIFRLRIEEFLALLFFGPMVVVTTRAYYFFEAQDKVPRVLIGDIQRVFAIVE